MTIILYTEFVCFNKEKKGIAILLKPNIIIMVDKKDRKKANKWVISAFSMQKMGHDSERR